MTDRTAKHAASVPLVLVLQGPTGIGQDGSCPWIGRCIPTGDYLSRFAASVLWT